MAVVMTLGNSKVIKIIAGFLCSILFLNALVSNVVDYTATQHMIRGGGGHSRRADDYLYEAIQNETLGVRHLKLLLSTCLTCAVRACLRHWSEGAYRQARFPRSGGLDRRLSG